MEIVSIQLLKPAKGATVTYQGELLGHDQGHILILARWDRPALDLGYVVFEPGDLFYEHFFTDRWYNIFELRGAAGALKGWYCNVARPAWLAGNTLISEDLELDLFVSPDRRQVLTLDLDEFEARGLAGSEPAAHAAALDALDDLKRMARDGASPFDHT